MADMLFKLPEKTVEALQKIADVEQVEVEKLLNQLVENFIEQRQLPDETEDDLAWLRAGQFASGKKDTGRNADEIIKAEWKPDKHD